ncbi:MAG: DUF4445 domain-containing protein [Anaerolineae bacterium]|nr:DUF4445 domain-containing protein [Anaerolineae bacterium]
MRTLRIEFEPLGRRGECSGGQSLLECAHRLGVDLASLCGGSGSCGRCKVQVLTGHVSPLTPQEHRSLSPTERAAGYRLACQATPLGDCQVHVPPESLTAPQRAQVEGQEIAVEPAPLVRAYALQLTPPSLQDGDLRADAARLQAALAQQHGAEAGSLDVAVLRRLSPQLRADRWQANVALRGDRGEVVALLPLSRRPLGLAVDLGTTKIAAYLVDLESGRTLAARGMMNPQIAHGEDLIARIAHAQEGPPQAARLQQLATEALNRLASELCTETGAALAEIVEAVVVGNTAMHHLFLGLPVASLGRAPYVPVVAAALDVKARDVGLEIAPGATVHMLPNVAGFVGADHVAMLLAVGAAQAGGAVLALDVGTNTEVCLVNRCRMTSASCASGPAFEGAHIKHGMRAANGAIEHLRLAGEQVEYQTIGGTPPVGLCGSGILDCLAELHRAGVLDARGKLGQHPRLRTGSDGVREFVLVSEAERGKAPAITITQQDVRQLQLAKGAVQAGIQVLLDAQALDAAEIEQVVIAGAFGTYIDLVSAIAVGMLPALPLERFRQVGNAAGMGARLALVSRHKRREAQELARRIEYVELASAPHFARIFARATALPPRPTPAA